MRDNYYRTGEGFMCVYAITMADSFDRLDNFFEQILRVTDRDGVPFVLVGNKCDLEEQRQVSKAKGKELADKYNCSFMETSAKDNTNVEEAFYTLIRETIKVKDAVSGKKTKKGGCSLL
jgi:GTPase KRas